MSLEDYAITEIHVQEVWQFISGSGSSESETS
jgi:hypothetical protein